MFHPKPQALVLIPTKVNCARLERHFRTWNQICGVARTKTKKQCLRYFMAPRKQQHFGNNQVIIYHKMYDKYIY